MSKLQYRQKFYKRLLAEDSCSSDASNWFALSGFKHKSGIPDYYNYFDPTAIASGSGEGDEQSTKNEVLKCMALCQQEPECAFFRFTTKQTIKVRDYRNCGRHFNAYF